MTDKMKMGEILQEEFTYETAIRFIREVLEKQTLDKKNSDICLVGLKFLEEERTNLFKENIEIYNRLDYCVENLTHIKLKEYSKIRVWSNIK